MSVCLISPPVVSFSIKLALGAYILIEMAGNSVGEGHVSFICLPAAVPSTTVVHVCVCVNRPDIWEIHEAQFTSSRTFLLIHPQNHDVQCRLCFALIRRMISCISSQVAASQAAVQWPSWETAVTPCDLFVMVCLFKWLHICCSMKYAVYGAVCFFFISLWGEWSGYMLHYFI